MRPRHDPVVPSSRRLAAAVVAIAAVGLAGCGGARPGQAAARDACKAYADTGRHQVATTEEQTEVIRETARSDAGRAAAADPEWQALQSDIDDFYSQQSALSQQSSADEVEAYFAADRRVQADCDAAGEDIGPLRP
jgi:hypothetical protein